MSTGAGLVLGTGIRTQLEHTERCYKWMSKERLEQVINDISEAIEYCETHFSKVPTEYKERLEALRGKRAADDPDRPAA